LEGFSELYQEHQSVSCNFLKALQFRYYYLQVLDMKTEAQKRSIPGLRLGLGKLQGETQVHISLITKQNHLVSIHAQPER
jgi:hypothetical protein